MDMLEEEEILLTDILAENEEDKLLEEVDTDRGVVSIRLKKRGKEVNARRKLFLAGRKEEELGISNVAIEDYAYKPKVTFPNKLDEEDEAILKIFDHLDAKSLGVAAQVSKKWNMLSHHPSLSGCPETDAEGPIWRAIGRNIPKQRMELLNDLYLADLGLPLCPESAVFTRGVQYSSSCVRLRDPSPLWMAGVISVGSPHKEETTSIVIQEFANDTPVDIDDNILQHPKRINLPNGSKVNHMDIHNNFIVLACNDAVRVVNTVDETITSSTNQKSTVQHPAIKRVWGVQPEGVHWLKDAKFTKSGEKVVGVAGNRAYLWDVESGKSEYHISAKDLSASVCPIMPNGSTFCSYHSKLKLWDFRSHSTDSLLNLQVGFKPNHNAMTQGNAASFDRNYLQHIGDHLIVCGNRYGIDMRDLRVPKSSLYRVKMEYLAGMYFTETRGNQLGITVNIYGRLRLYSMLPQVQWMPLKFSRKSAQEAIRGFKGWNDIHANEDFSIIAIAAKTPNTVDKEDVNTGLAVIDGRTKFERLNFEHRCKVQ